MATESITQFPSLAAGQVASDDLLPIVDVSDLTSPTGTTKKVLVSSIQQGQNFFNSAFNVRSPAYGAVGNGATEDYPAFLAAITAADAAGGGIVYVPLGTYLISTQIVLPAGVVLVGCGMGKGSVFGSRLKWAGAGFCVKAGNTAGTLSYGCSVRDLGINIMSATAHGLLLYGVVDCAVSNVYIEGQPGTVASIGVQIDGADCGAFFILMQNVTCNHTFKGFVHTTTGSVRCTQVTGINCSAHCDDVAGSIGVDIQSVGGQNCGDGVTYVSGNLEHCKIGLYTNSSGTTIMGARFENPQGTSEDIKFDTNARCNQVIGGSNIYTITNVSESYTNQVMGAPKDQTGATSQPNILDDTTVKNLVVAQNINGTPTIGTTSNLTFAANGAATRYVISNTGATYAGRHVYQAGNGSTGAGGAVNLYGHAHATKPGDVVAAISAASGGKFRVNDGGLDDGTDRLIVSSSGLQVPDGFGCNGTTPQTPVVGGAALATYGAGANGFDTAGHAQEIHDKLNIVLAALRANGILTT